MDENPIIVGLCAFIGGMTVIFPSALLPVWVGVALFYMVYRIGHWFYWEWRGMRFSDTRRTRTHRRMNGQR